MPSNAVSAPGLRSAPFNRAQNMAAYDKLPKAIRLALQEANHNWSAAGIRRDMRRLKLKSASVVEKLRQRESEVADKYYSSLAGA